MSVQMSVNVGENLLSPKQERAVLLVAADQISNKAIAQQVRIAERTLDRWSEAIRYKPQAPEAGEDSH